MIVMDSEEQEQRESMAMDRCSSDVLIWKTKGILCHEAHGAYVRKKDIIYNYQCPEVGKSIL